MNPTVPIWMPGVLALFVNSVAVVLAGWISTGVTIRHVDAVAAQLKSKIDSTIDGPGAEMKQYIAEAELRIIKEILELKSRVERLEEQRGLIQR